MSENIEQLNSEAALDMLDSKDSSRRTSVDQSVAAPYEPIEYRETYLKGKCAKRAYACSCERVGGRYAYRFFKRLFDIVFSACVIVILLAPSIILCIAIRAESPGAPIYVQRRVGCIGKHGEIITFPMLKFRSMYKDADQRLEELKHLNEADGPLFKMKDDPRVTRIGKFIRKHSLDELPQFINCFFRPFVYRGASSSIT